MLLRNHEQRLLATFHTIVFAQVLKTGSRLCALESIESLCNVDLELQVRGVGCDGLINFTKPSTLTSELVPLMFDNENSNNMHFGMRVVIPDSCAHYRHGGKISRYDGS